MNRKPILIALAIVFLMSIGFSQTTTTYYFFEGNTSSANYTFPAFGDTVSDNYTKVSWNTLQNTDRMTITPYSVLAEDAIGYYEDPEGTFQNYLPTQVLNLTYWYVQSVGVGGWSGQIRRNQYDSSNYEWEMNSGTSQREIYTNVSTGWTLASDYICFTESEKRDNGYLTFVNYSVENESNGVVFANYTYYSNVHTDDVYNRICLNVSDHIGEDILFRFRTTQASGGSGYFTLDDLSESNMSLQYPSDIQIETTHGYTIYSGSGELNSTLQVPNFNGAINSELLLCSGPETCDIYFNITSSTAGILELSNLTFTETPYDRNGTQFNASSISYDFKDCALDTGVYYSYGSQSYNWSCWTESNVPHNFSALPTSQGEGSVDITNPETFPMMYIVPLSGYQDFNLTFTVAADTGYYYGGIGAPLISKYRNFGSLKILGIDNSHSGSYKSYWDVNIVPAGEEGSAQALKFTVRWYLANATLKQVSQSYPNENALICPTCAGDGAIPKWINVRLLRDGSNYYVYYKHHYENESAWTQVASFVEGEGAPLYNFERMGVSNINTDIGRYSTYLDNITGDFDTYSVGGGTNDISGYLRIDDGDGIKDSGDTMIEGAKVTLYYDSSVIATDYTDTGGYFEFNDLSDGFYQVSVDVVQDPDGEYDTNFHEAFDVNVEAGKAFDSTTYFSDGRGYWKSVAGNVQLMFNTIETGMLKAKVTSDGTTPISGATITNAYYSGGSYTINDGYCLTNSSGECILFLYTAEESPNTQGYKIYASYGGTTKNQITGVSIDTLTSIFFVMNYTQRYYIVPAETNRVDDIGDITIDPYPIIINQYIEDIYFRVWDVVESRYYSESYDGTITEYTIEIDGVPFYLQKEGGVFCLNYVENPTLETCRVHYKHNGADPYVVNISVTLASDETAEANQEYYPSYAVMSEGRKKLTTVNASHQKVWIEMVDDDTRIAMTELNNSGFYCKWDGTNMTEDGTFSTIIVAGTGNSQSGTLTCYADNYSTFQREATVYLGTTIFDDVSCEINNGAPFPATKHVGVVCYVEAEELCSGGEIKSGITVKINQNDGGAYDVWKSLQYIGDDSESENLICNQYGCCNPRMVFEASDVFFRWQDGSSPSAWSYLVEGSHYMDIFVNDSSSTLTAYAGETLYDIDNAAPSTEPELMSVALTPEEFSSTDDLECTVTYTNPQKQIQHILVEITKVVNTKDLDSPENTYITASIPNWYLEQQALQSVYKYTYTFEPSSCDDSTYTCTYQLNTSGTEFSIKNDQQVKCTAKIMLKDSSTYEAGKTDTAIFSYTPAGTGEGIISFGQGIFDNPYYFLLGLAVLAISMPIIVMLLGALLRGG